MLAFDRQGSGAPLLLLHGTNSSRSIWKPLLPQLSSEREVLSVDLPAHGQSPPSSFAPLDWAQEVAALLDHLELERVAVVGQILGERVATRPLRTSIGRRMSLRQISANPADVPADVATEMVKTVLASKHFSEHFKQTRRLRFTGGRQISRDVPIRIVWGNRDEIARARTSQHTDQIPEHATVETWPECGHMLMWDAPERVVQAALAMPPTSRGSQVSAQ
jgi:pimeloyl-ACP methyl ester carboxylesterase